MKLFSAKTMLPLVMLIALFSFNACQKEAVPTPNVSQQPTLNSDDRSANGVTYGVTVFNNGSPSRIIGLRENNGAVVYNNGAFYVDNNGDTIVLDNLKGICYTAWGQYFLTTGAPASTVLGGSIYDNSLFKVDPTTGQCGFFGSTSPSGAMSDLEYDPVVDRFYGLRSNTNSIFNISQGAGNYTAYSTPVAITGIASGYTLSGLTLVRDNTGMYLVGGASRSGAVSKLYRIPAAGGAATFLTDLNPVNDFKGGHMGMGYDIQLNHMAINRTNAVLGIPAGLSEINPWVAPPAGVTATNAWGLGSFNYEDLTSYIY